LIGDGGGVGLPASGRHLRRRVVLGLLDLGRGALALALAGLLDVDALAAADGQSEGAADGDTHTGLPPGAGKAQDGRERGERNHAENLA
jgi:hypothetical protein